MGETVSKRLMMPTDVAHIMLFHPDDLAHAKDWPFDWYGDAHIYPHESAAGRLVCWCTKSDGGYAVRLTDGAITEREQRYAGPSWVFPYTVRHKRIYLDNSDALPHQFTRNSTDDYPDYWFDLADGDYAVTVTALAWHEEPQAEEEGFETLPNYVVQFAPANGRVIAPAKRPPDLEGALDAVANDAVRAGSGVKTQSADLVEQGRLYPAFASANVMPEGRSFSTQGEAALDAAIEAGKESWAVMDILFVVGARIEPGALAVLAKCHGTHSSEGSPTQYDLDARQLVRITEVDGIFEAGHHRQLKMKGWFGKRLEEMPANALHAVRVEAVTPAANSAAPTEVAVGVAAGVAVAPAEEARASIIDMLIHDLENGGMLAGRLGGLASYEALKLDHYAQDEFTADWMIDHVPMDADMRLALSHAPMPARLDGAIAAYQKAAGRG